MEIATIESLTPVETGELRQHEAIIERGLNTFVDVGNALASIRDARLYRQSHGTFEDYCRERWNLSRKRAYDMVAAAETVRVLSPIGDTPQPATESQARELAPLKAEPEKLAEAWSEAVETAQAENRDVTAADVKAAVAPRRDLGVHFSSATDEWATPQDLFDMLDAEFGFTLDVCALDSSAKCAEYFTPQTDGLAQQWTGACWMNPPYGNEIGAWIEKAWKSAQAGATVVCLVPARVDTAWWWDYCRFGEIRFLRGRLKFGDAETSAPFPSAVVVFSGDLCGVKWWDWRNG